MNAPALSVARQVWHLLEPIHAVTYFAPESGAAAKDVGFRGFWMGYFGFRAAPLGPVGPGVVTAVFSNFARPMVERSLPDAWVCAPVPAALEARSTSAAAALRRLSPGVEDAAAAVIPVLRDVVQGAPGAGRPLFAANRDLPEPPDPVAALWQAATTLREHRGDGHVACLTAAGIDGCQAHVLFAVCEAVPVDVLRDNRGWTDDEWEAAGAELAARGLVDGGTPTERGRATRAELEARTDALADRAFTDLSVEALTELRSALAEITSAVLASGVIPFPNPMGLPAPRFAP